jgi:hypothetical protein
MKILLKLLLTVFLSVSSFPLLAAIPAVSITYCGAQGYSYESVCASSPEQAFILQLLPSDVLSGPVSCESPAGFFKCSAMRTSGLITTRYLTIAATCPAGSHLPGQFSTSCDCDIGFTESGNQCIKPDAPPPPPQCPGPLTKQIFKAPISWCKLDSSGYCNESSINVSDLILPEICSGHCLYTVSGLTDDTDFYYSGSANQVVPVGFNLEYAGAGSSCQTDTDLNTPQLPKPDGASNDTPKTEQECTAQGGSWGSVNGVDTCIGASGSGDGSGDDPNCADGNNPACTDGQKGGDKDSGEKVDGKCDPTETATCNPDGTPKKNPLGSKECADNPTTCTDSNAGPDLPAQPKLWEPKYPEGIQSVWDSKMSELNNTSLVGLGKRLLPTSIDNGSAPLWTLDFPLFGSFVLKPDSSIWPALRALVIVSALVYAFKIIRGV